MKEEQSLTVNEAKSDIEKRRVKEERRVCQQGFKK
jgi:hypothetical protein